MNNRLSTTNRHVKENGLISLEEMTAPRTRREGAARPKVMLLFPPNWTPTMPHLALPN
jgi:hypothetical protein